MYIKKYIQLILPCDSSWPVQKVEMVNQTPSAGDPCPNKTWILSLFSPFPKSIMAFFLYLSPLYRAHKSQEKTRIF